MLLEYQIDQMREIDPKSYEILVRVYITDEGYYKVRSSYEIERSFYRDIKRAEKKFGQNFGATYQNV